MVIDEGAIPFAEQVTAACELLGIDPLHLANEGKLIAICDAADAPRLLEVMRADPLARAAAQIGRVIDSEHCFVEMETSFGGRRILDWLVGDALPRIC